MTTVTQTLARPIYSAKRAESVISNERKDEPVFLWIVTSWICALLYFNPRLLALTYAAPNFFAKICVVTFVLCLDSFWLFAIYNSTMIAVSLWRPTVKKSLPKMVLMSNLFKITILVLLRVCFAVFIFKNHLLLKINSSVVPAVKFLMLLLISAKILLHLANGKV